jgi:hypothetical protein
MPKPYEASVYVSVKLLLGVLPIMERCIFPRNIRAQEVKSARETAIAIKYSDALEKTPPSEIAAVLGKK